MKFTATPLLLILLPLASALTLGAPTLTSRSVKKMDGKCTSPPKYSSSSPPSKPASGGCKVPGGVHSAYACWNSHCGAGDEGKNCTIAPGMNGDWVAKCPENELPYAWNWPWTPPTDGDDNDNDGKGGKGKGN